MTFAVVLVLGVEFGAAGLVAGRLHHVLALGAALPGMAALAAAAAAPPLLLGRRAGFPALFFPRHRLPRVGVWGRGPALGFSGMDPRHSPDRARNRRAQV